MFDTHAHLNFKVFDAKVEEVIDGARAVGVEHFVIPGTDIESSKKAVELASRFNGVYAAVGIHPHHVYEKLQETSYKKQTKEEIKKIQNLLGNNKVVAIGEIGIDRYIYQKTKYGEYKVDEEFIKLQKEYFVAQLKLAVEYKKAVIIHCREAKGDLIGVMRDIWGSWGDWLEGKTVFHCCEAEEDLLKFAIEKNIFVGVDGDVTYPSTSLRTSGKAEFVKKIPLDRLVLETDSPFLLPVKDGKKLPFPNTPANLKIISDFVADLRGESKEKIKEITQQNAKILFGLV